MTATLPRAPNLVGARRDESFFAEALSLTEPLGFEAGDANLTRYVGNSPPNKIDPDGLQEKEPGRPLQRPTLNVPVIVIKMTAQPSTVDLSKKLLATANGIFEQCDVSISKRTSVFPGRPGTAGKTGRIVFDFSKHEFSGGGWNGTTLKEFLESVPNIPTAENGIRIILVDEIKGPGAQTAGVTYRPDKEIGRRQGLAIVLAVDPRRNKETDDPGRALAHECGNYLGLPDEDRGGFDGTNLMSYGRRSQDGTTLIRGTELNDEQTRLVRDSIGKMFPPE